MGRKWCSGKWSVNYSNYTFQLVSSRPYLSATLLDLWISGCFVHAVFLLVVDLTLPARRLRYALLVDVDDDQSRPRQTVLKSGKPYTAVRGFMQKIAERMFGFIPSEDSSTHVISMPPESALVQRRVTTTTLGDRKKFALLAVAASYATFVVVYCVILSSID
ncbi:hypothetical protein OSTOST_04272 [Ostertagia ostertagi]